MRRVGESNVTVSFELRTRAKRGVARASLALLNRKFKRFTAAGSARCRCEVSLDRSRRSLARTPCTTPRTPATLQ
jgi:hypothetical protein